jgi:hypothetical protein
MVWDMGPQLDSHLFVNPFYILTLFGKLITKVQGEKSQ